MKKEDKAKLAAAQKRLDDLRGDVGTVLAVIQDIVNELDEEKEEDTKNALEEAVSALDEIDDAFGTADDSLTTAMEG